MTAAVVTAVLCTGWRRPATGLRPELSRGAVGARIPRPPTQRGPQLLVHTSRSGHSPRCSSSGRVPWLPQLQSPARARRLRALRGRDHDRDAALRPVPRPAGLGARRGRHRDAGGRASLPGVVASRRAKRLLGQCAGRLRRWTGEQSRAVRSLRSSPCCTPPRRGIFERWAWRLKKGTEHDRGRHRGKKSRSRRHHWEALERQLWPDGRSLGQRLRSHSSPPAWRATAWPPRSSASSRRPAPVRRQPSRDVFVSPFSQAPPSGLNLVDADGPAIRRPGRPSFVRRCAAPVPAASHRACLAARGGNQLPYASRARRWSLSPHLMAALPGGLVSLAGLFALLDPYARVDRIAFLNRASAWRLGASPGRLCCADLRPRLSLSTARADARRRAGDSCDAGPAESRLWPRDNRARPARCRGPRHRPGLRGRVAVSARRVVAINPIASIRQT